MKAPARLATAVLVLACAACATSGPDSQTESQANIERSNAAPTSDSPVVTPVSPQSATFIVAMIDARLMGYLKGKLANERGSTPELRSYGARLMKDQKLLLRDLGALATASAVTIPQALSASGQAGVKGLNDADDEQFDQVFIRSVRADQQRDIQEFQKATQFKDAAVSRFASRNLPVIQAYLATINQIAQGK